MATRIYTFAHWASERFARWETRADTREYHWPSLIVGFSPLLRSWPPRRKGDRDNAIIPADYRQPISAASDYRRDSICFSALPVLPVSLATFQFIHPVSQTIRWKLSVTLSWVWLLLPPWEIQFRKSREFTPTACENFQPPCLLDVCTLTALRASIVSRFRLIHDRAGNIDEALSIKSIRLPASTGNLVSDDF